MQSLGSEEHAHHICGLVEKEGRVSTIGGATVGGRVWSLKMVRNTTTFTPYNAHLTAVRRTSGDALPTAKGDQIRERAKGTSSRETRMARNLGVTQEDGDPSLRPENSRCSDWNNRPSEQGHSEEPFKGSSAGRLCSRE